MPEGSELRHAPAPTREVAGPTPVLQPLALDRVRLAEGSLHNGAPAILARIFHPGFELNPNRFLFNLSVRKNQAMNLNPSLVLPLLAALLAPMKAKAQSNPPGGTALPAASLNWKIQREAEMQYLFYLPKDHDAKSGQRWPLMLFLHGAGERGTNVQRAGVHGPLKLVKQGREFPFIIVAPQCPTGQLWESEPLLQLLDHVTAKYAVDTNRVYLTGLSMGGYGTWRLGLAHPGRFAALVPICGGGSRIDALLGPGDKGALLKNLPIWAFHGAKDAVVPLDESERMVNALQKAGVKDVKLTVYPEANHDSWTETYNNPELYEWLLSHSRAGGGPKN